MRTMDNFQAINAIMTNNFNPELLERYSGYGGINVIRLRLIVRKKKYNME